jgi:hypothetical protein
LAVLQALLLVLPRVLNPERQPRERSSWQLQPSFVENESALSTSALILQKVESFLGYDEV